MNIPRRSLVALCIGLMASQWLTMQSAQAFDFFWTGGTGAWNVGSNWDQNPFYPTALDEGVGVIGSNEAGATPTGGVATLSAVTEDAGGIVLGRDAGTSGTLRVLSGGSIALIDTTGDPIGVANIGLGGTGTLEVQGGGTFSTTLVDMNPGSLLEIGGGVGSASVTSTDGMWLAGRTITHGSGHTFEAATFVNFEGGTQYVVDLTSASHTTLTAGGDIGGVQGPLVVKTSGGYAPALNSTWTILDGETISGAGFEVDLSEMSVPAGTGYSTQIVENGGRQQLELKYEALPTLTVNTDTGAMSLSSQSGAAINLTGYIVRSASGQINPANWNSLSDQGSTGWEEGGTPTANALAELNAENSLALSTTPDSLGTSVLVPPAQFGVTPDITFEYGVDGEFSVKPGLVEFTGSKAVNNLLLTVDPTTGEGQLENSSPFTIDVVAYNIQSASGALDSDNWTSLDFQSVSGWDAGTIAPDEFALSEFVPEDPPATLAPGESYSLGTMFQIGGTRDLALEFALMIYGLPGDFNADGQVNIADYTLWRNNLGAADESAINDNGDGGGITTSDYDLWKANFGATGGIGGAPEIRQGIVQYGSITGTGAGIGAAISAPVPEPTAGLLVVVSLAVLVPVGFRFRHRSSGL
ncbi:hypothetical protein [Aeoliella sp.]|uniref:hypothetical protein n=1 Tax=Aeoliella sp. TaxID=2795800 RepID=UPI003CCC0A24